MSITRLDWQRVITDDGRVWDEMTEIEVKEHSEGFEPILLSAARRTLDPHYIEKWMRRIGKRCSILVVQLTVDGWPDATLGIGGIVKSVSLAPYDSQSSDAARDTIEILPRKVYRLD